MYNEERKTYITILGTHESGCTIQDLIESVDGIGAKVVTETFLSMKDQVGDDTSLGPQHFEMISLLGKGATARVILVRCLLNQRVYAMKVLDKVVFQSQTALDSAVHERRVMARVRLLFDCHF